MIPKRMSMLLLWIIILNLNTIPVPVSSSINNIFTRSIIPDSSMNSNLIQSIGTGAQVAYDYCQKAFKWERWNCPESIFLRRNKYALTKESAYAKAIISAGVVHTITKNCSLGLIENCGCDPTLGSQQQLKMSGRSIDQAEFNSTELKNKNKNKNEPFQWAWGGCSDHIDYGVKMAKTYLDEDVLELDKLKNDERQEAPARHIQFNLHNNRIGRNIVKETMIRRCICHGVSGSCALQTCWMQVAPFATIANKLKEKYSRAIRVEIELEDNESDNSGMKRMNAVYEMPQSNEMDLVYLEDSPNYCKGDNATGWPGTKGRTCSRNKQGATAGEKRSCRNICRSCGYRVRKLKRVVRERCNCKFKWCCEVKCDICTKTVEEFTCA